MTGIHVNASYVPGEAGINKMTEIRIKEEPINEALMFSGVVFYHWYSSTNIHLIDFQKGSTIKVNSFSIGQFYVDSIPESKWI